jgi:hypothetical protein
MSGFYRGGSRGEDRVAIAKAKHADFMLERKRKEDIEAVEASKGAMKAKAVETGKDLYSKYLNQKTKQVMDQDSIKTATSKIYSHKAGKTVDVNTFGEYGESPVGEFFGLKEAGVNPALYESVGHGITSNYGMTDISDAQKILMGKEFTQGKIPSALADYDFKSLPGLPGKGGQFSGTIDDMLKIETIAAPTKMATAAEETLKAAGGMSSGIGKHILPGLGVGMSAYDLFTAETPEEYATAGIGAASSTAALLGSVATTGALGSGALASGLATFGGPVGVVGAVGLTAYSLFDSLA